MADETSTIESVTADSTSGSETADRKALEEKVASKLDALNASDPDYNAESDEVGDDGGTSAEVTGAQAAAETDASDEAEAEAASPEVEKTGTQEATKEAAATAPTLPDAHRRSLMAYGWTQEEIDQNLAALGPQFLTTAAKLHSNRNDETQRWAQVGRQARQSPDQTGSPAATTGAGTIGKLDLAALKAEHGDDPLLDAIVSPVNAIVETVNRLLPALQAGQQAAEQAKTEAIGKNVESFFGQKTLAQFSDLYGDPAKGLTQANLEARSRVLEFAHDLIYGAQLARGQRLALDEALTLAHDMVTKDRQEQVVRNQLTATLKKRQRSIVTRPSASGKTPVSGPAKSRAEAEARAGVRLREVFGT